MKTWIHGLAGFAAVVASLAAGASCLPERFSTISSDNGYFYVFDDASGGASSETLVGRFWSPGAYAATGEQQCDESHWLLPCPGCGGGPQGRTWYVDGTFGQMGCDSGCPKGEMILSLEDRSVSGDRAYFSVSRVNETPLGSPEFDFARSGRNWTLVPIPVPFIESFEAGEVFRVWFSIADPAPGFYGLPGAEASGTITALWVYTAVDPNSVDRSAWTFVGRYPYTGGATSGETTLVCPWPGKPYLATALELDGGQVVTTYVSGGTLIDCDPYAPGAGAVRDGGPSGLFVSRQESGDLTLTWGRSCSVGDSDYEVYEGMIGDWTSHTSKTCSTGGATNATFPPPPFDAYYLVVPVEGAYEGSYGSRSGGEERAQGTSPCRPRIVNVCPP